MNRLIAPYAFLLTPYYGEEALRIAWWLLEHATGKTQAELVAYAPELTREQDAQIRLWISEIVEQHKPLHYILGFVPFLGLEIAVQPPTLIPRPETEAWVADCIAYLTEQKIIVSRILDLCTGTGCVALAFARAFPEAQIVGVDIADGALELACQNAQKNKIVNVAFLKSDLYAAVAGQQFDLIVANPPYISAQEHATLDANVRTWEDPRALVAENDGYALIEKILNDAHRYLKPAQFSNVWVEMGWRQGPRVQEIARRAGLHNVTILKDSAHHDRVLMASSNS